jgi:UDP-N-acetylglucosamine 2-epimerase (non-hydrolysing)
MKIAPLIRAISGRPECGIQFRLVHTGQHYDENLSRIFFEELEIPSPDANLAVGSGSQAEQTGRIMIGFERDLVAHPPDLVVVVGDVNSTMACAIVAKKLQVKVAHIEAGIRSFDFTMPEEVNRVVTDALADLYFTTSTVAGANLIQSGVDPRKIYFVGNIMIDSLLWVRHRGGKRPVVFDQYSLLNKGYMVITLHRPSNVDDTNRIREILEAIEAGIGDVPAVFPVHPRTAGVLKKANWTPKHMILIEPLSYFEFVYLLEHARGVVTDSGGVQEETTVLGVPCITLRLNTERPETISSGTNELVGDDLARLVVLLKSIKSGTWRKGTVPDLWDGQTAERIVLALSELKL